MKKPPSSQKLRGGYYTPQPVADFLARWAVRDASDQILEPSAGDGAIATAVARRLQKLVEKSPGIHGSLTAVEIDHIEAAKVQEQLSSIKLPDGCVHVEVGDFFSFARNGFLPSDLFSSADKGGLFDAVIGNPPFIRYQNFPEAHRAIAFELMELVGIHPNRLTNAWLPFLIVSSLLVRPHGRVAMVVPAELLQVNYASEGRLFLSKFFDRITLISFRSLLFTEIQQEVVLVLAEKRAGHAHGIRVIELDSAADLERYNHEEALKGELKPLDHSTDKWTQYFLSAAQIRLLRELAHDQRVDTVRKYMEVDVGLVTGRNDFFVLDDQKVTSLELERDVQRIVARSAHLAGLVFSESDWKGHAASGQPAYLFAPSASGNAPLSAASRRYILHGEREGVNTGYKCRIRKQWFAVPSQWIPGGFMLRQVHSFPKLVVNQAQAMSTDTIHRVRFTNGRSPKLLAAAFINSLTFAFSEIRGRSYGGGVLTFEPSEVESLPLPLVGSHKLPVAETDKLLRAGKIEVALDLNDAILLREGLGLSEKQVQLLRGIWQRLRDRRIRRRA